MLIVRTLPTSFSSTNKKVLHCFCTVTSETQICNLKLSHTSKVMVKVGGLNCITSLCWYWPHLHLSGTWISLAVVPVQIYLACRYFESSKSVAASNLLFTDALTRSPTSSRPWAGGTLDLDTALGYSLSDSVYICFWTHQLLALAAKSRSQASVFWSWSYTL